MCPAYALQDMAHFSCTYMITLFVLLNTAYGFAGAASSFNKCYNPATDETTDGVWKGSLTNVTSPENYIEPEMCTEAEYTQCDTDDDCSLEIDQNCNCYVSSSFHPFDPCEGMDPSECSTDKCSGDECKEYGNKATCSPGYDGTGSTCQLDYGVYSEFPTPAPTDDTKKWVGFSAKCYSDEQCSVKIRSRAPAGQHTGVGLCGCYVASTLGKSRATFLVLLRAYITNKFTIILLFLSAGTGGLDPFDECEGRPHSCRIARCAGDSCDGLGAYCNLTPDDNGLGGCALRRTTLETELSDVA